MSVADAWSLAAADPDRDLIEWLETGCPAGAARPVRDGGIFPPLQQGQKSDLKEFITGLEPSSNYSSVEEAPEKAASEIDRAVANGYAVYYRDWQELRQELGEVLVSKLACLVKSRPDGSEKVRIVVDLRRSGYNSCVEAAERIVLPRLRDVVENALLLASHREADERIMFLTVDFEDAFHSMGLHPDEVKFLCAKHPRSGFIAYRTVLFGGAAFPLVWGRGAAFAGRSAQSMFDADRCRVEVFVDDPCATLRCTVTVIAEPAAKLIMWWLALGLRIAWGKGFLLSLTTWIGASIDARQLDRVSTAIPDKYRVEVLHLIESMMEVDPTMATVRQLAGKLSFAASIVPTLWAHAACLWAALAETEAAVLNKSTATGRKHQPWLVKVAKVANKRIRHALEWMAILFGQAGALSRTFHLANH